MSTICSRILPFFNSLLGALKHFLADEWDKARAQKRGGGVAPLPLEFESAEARYSREPVHQSTPEQDYERRWAIAVLEQATSRLRGEYEREGRGELFTLLHPCLIGARTDQPYAEIAKNLGASEGTVKSAVHRLRQRYRQLLREEVAGTVMGQSEVEEELRHLCAVLAASG